MIDNLSDLPASWVCKRLKFVIHIDTSGVWGDEPGENDYDLPTVTTTNITNLGRVDLLNTRIRSYTNIDAEYYKCRPRDIVVVKASGSATSIQPSLQQILRLLQINLFERRDLLELLRGDPPKPRISSNQTALLFS